MGRRATSGRRALPAGGDHPRAQPAAPRARRGPARRRERTRRRSASILRRIPGLPGPAPAPRRRGAAAPTRSPRCGPGERDRPAARAPRFRIWRGSPACAAAARRRAPPRGPVAPGPRADRRAGERGPRPRGRRPNASARGERVRRPHAALHRESRAPRPGRALHRAAVRTPVAAPSSRTARRRGPSLHPGPRLHLTRQFDGRVLAVSSARVQDHAVRDQALAEIAGRQVRDHAEDLADQLLRLV